LLRMPTVRSRHRTAHFRWDGSIWSKSEAVRKGTDKLAENSETPISKRPHKSITTELATRSSTSEYQSSLLRMASSQASTLEQSILEQIQRRIYWLHKWRRKQSSSLC
uniref:DUF2510 domain-containing protein n=1 Tax=Heligmosomoides polygyrus TaxID=6339 RepID=A0A183GFK1_HELPZ